jgi:glycosyltransferase involved in cell wall biosynthesis
MTDLQPNRAPLPLSVIMITRNEAHNLESVLENLDGFAAQVFIVDSYSSDATVDIALARGVHIVQHAFEGFGAQWNFALETLPVETPWTMKLDPDERLTDELKASIAEAVSNTSAIGLSLTRRLWFMGHPLPVRQQLTRLWRTGQCRFSGVTVNEHPLVNGEVMHVGGDLEHHDSPHLHHWYAKQNAYTSAEALAAYEVHTLAAEPNLTGSPLQRRMWLKQNIRKLPLRFILLFLYHYLVLGAWRAGRVGYIWSHLRVEVYRTREYKLLELRLTGRAATLPAAKPNPDSRVPQY